VQQVERHLTFVGPRRGARPVEDAALVRRLARLERVAIVSVTACRWLIVTPTLGAYRRPNPEPGGRALPALPE